MQERIEIFSGTGDPLVFAHANGYPPGSYRQLLEPLTSHYRVSAIRHRPLWGEPEPPSRLRWQLFADDLLAALAASEDGPVWLLGHSLGAVVGLLAAARKPALFRGLLLLDPVFLPTRFVAGMALTPASRLRRMPMIRRALSRPDLFANEQDAFDFYRGKRAFRDLDDTALWHYVAASTGPARDHEGVRLLFPPAWEAAIYGTAPWVWPILKRVSLPVLGLRGEDSTTLSAAAFSRWGRLQESAELHTVPGGHLFPLEHADDTAAVILDFLQRHGG